MIPSLDITATVEHNQTRSRHTMHDPSIAWGASGTHVKMILTGTPYTVTLELPVATVAALARALGVANPRGNQPALRFWRVSA